MKRVTAAFIILVLSIAIVRVLAQLSEAPPQVVYLSPTDEIPIDEPLTLMFNQAMNHESVEAAWSIDPTTEGTLSWKNDYTLIFTPSSTWQRDTDYTIRLTEEARSLAGLGLIEPYESVVHTLSNLKVNSVQPADDSVEVLADAVLTVAFSSPVVPLMAVEDMDTLPNPIVIEPAISGTGEWLNTFVYQFTPEEPWAGSTTYTVTVKAGLTDVGGAPLVEDYQWQFTTILPEILSYSPYQGSQIGLEDPMTVTFSQPMDTAATATSIQVTSQGTAVSGRVEWSEDHTVLTFVPLTPLAIDTDYRIQIDQGIARSVTGAALKSGLDYTFRTIPLPYVSGIYPNIDYIVYPGVQRLQINFGTRMDMATLEQAVTVSPTPNVFTQTTLGETYIYYDIEFLPNTEYTITVDGDVKDVYGNALGADYTAVFPVQDTPGIVSKAQFALSQRFIVTGAYRQNTSIAMNVAGDPTMNFTLSRVAPESIWRVFQNYYDPAVVNEVLQDSQPVRDWSETFTTETDYAYKRLNLAGEQGGRLDTGVYLLTGMRDQPTVIAVTDTNITVKRVADELFIWTTDMQTGAPQPNQEITVYKNEFLYKAGTTDSEGLLRLPVEGGPETWLTIISQAGDHYGVWRSYNPSAPRLHDVYLYTDRPIYRPGETLYYRGIYRQRDDNRFFINTQNPLRIEIRDSRGEVILDEDVMLNEFGSFSGEIQLEDTLPTGQIYLYVREQNDDYQSWSAYAQVAEFRVPEYKVSVTAEQAEFDSGEAVRALVNTTYFSGGAVSNADVNWTVTSSQTSFNYTGQGRYSFVDWANYDYYGTQNVLASATAKTDAAGNFMIDVPNAETQGMYPESLLIEASISDESGQSIAGRTTALLHGTDTYIGVRTTTTFGRENEPFTAEIIAVNPQSDPLANETITLNLVERRWSGNYRDGWTSEDIVVETTTVTTGQDGKATYEFTPPNPGSFTVQAVTDTYRSGAQIYVSGSSRAVKWGNSANGLTLLPDKEVYTPGETAQIFMQIPFEGTSWALITVEREGVIQHEVVKVEGSSLLYDLPITADHEPGIYLSVSMVHGVDANNTSPAFAQQGLRLIVEPVNKRLNITIVPSTTDAKPGDVVTFDILATDPTGKPVQAEFGLMMVDAAILSLSGPNSTGPEGHYYQLGSNQTQTDTMLSASLDKSQDEIFGSETVNEVAINVTPTPVSPIYAPGLIRTTSTPSPTGTVTMMLPSATMGALGIAANSADFSGEAAAEPLAARSADMAESEGQQAPAPDIRSDFEQTPLWDAHVVTDAQGRAQVSVTMPDNLTIWSLTARAVTADTLIGEVKLDIASTLPLLVRPVAPRFFVVHDEVTLGMVINNNTDDFQDVKASLQGTGYEFVGNATADQNVLIEPHSRARVDWRVRILDEEFVDVTFTAIGADGFQDASKPPLSDDGKIPVYKYLAPETVGTSGVLREAGSRTEGIVIPPIADISEGDLTVKIDHSLAATTLDSLDYLQNYPYQCIEQTVSRFLPNLITMRALQQLNVNSPELEANLDEAVAFGLNKLATTQNYDGGWGWFPQMESNPLVSAYALLGLIEARASGYDVSGDLLVNVMMYLRQQIIVPQTNTSPWELNRQAFFFYVLARGEASMISMGELDALMEHRIDMSYGARAYLLMTYQLLGGQEQVQTLATDLKSAAKVSATGAHWEEDQVDWWNWGSDVRTTSLVLMALLKVDPQWELLPNAVRWLIVARDGDHWQSTQETTWAVMSLTDWMLVTRELEGNYSYSVTLNDEAPQQDFVVPETVRESDVLTFEIQELLIDDLNRLTIARDGGNGALYYTAHLNLQLDASQVKALNRGIGIQREYLIDDEPVTEANVGDVIKVRLTVTVPETVYYVAVESPLPAGAEVVDQSLLTTAQASTSPDYGYIDYGYGYGYGYYDYHYYWNYSAWDHTDIRDEKVELYADVLYPGTYVYSYEMRASVPGVFQVIPANGFAFYFPEVMGRTDGGLFTISQ